MIKWQHLLPVPFFLVYCKIHMILDEYISFHDKVMISVLCAGLWIYFRTSDCYAMIPRLHLFPVIFVTSWAYINYFEPLALPIGLLVLIAYKEVNRRFYLNRK